MSGIVSSFKTEYERKLHPTQNTECTYITVPTSLVFCVVVFIQSRLNLPQMVGSKAPPSVCSLAFFSRSQSTIPSSSIIFLCIGSSCGNPGHCISSLWEPGISCIIPKSCKAPPFLSCSFMLKWARVSSITQWVIASAFRRASRHTEFSSLLLPYAMFLLTVQMSSWLSHMAFWIPHKEMNCCLFRYGNVQLWVSAKQLGGRETVLFQVPGRDRCVSCQLLTLPCDISLLIGIVTMRELLPKKSIT